MFTKKRPLVKTARGAQPASTAVASSEVYLRRDIGCGAMQCVRCLEVAHAGYEPCVDAMETVLIPDTNIVLHNTNVLEDPRVKNIIFLSTVLQETQNRNKSVYVRVTKMLADAEKRCYVMANDRHESTHCRKGDSETMNDFNDRQIKAAAEWYTRHFATIPLESSAASAAPSKGVFLVTHDRNLRNRCGVNAAQAAPPVESGGTSVEESGPAPPSLRCVMLREYIATALGDECDLLDKLEHVVPEGMKETEYSGSVFEPYCTVDEAQRRILDGSLIKGKFRVSESSCFFGEIRGKWEGRPYDRVLVGGKFNCNRAIHDDVVAVEVLPVGQWRPASKKIEADPSLSPEEALQKGYTPCGKVVCIVEPHRRQYCGSLVVGETEKVAGLTGSISVMFQPKSNRIPRIKLVTRNAEDLMNKRLSVVIDDWPAHMSSPVGHYVEVLGLIGDKDTEAKVILLEHDIPHYDFSQAVYDCLPKGEWRVEDSEVAKRLDLRSLCVVSVDPLGCRDIDDALHCRELPNGNIEVGVHIADVTHFLSENTPMDVEAAKRSTSVYLVDRRINMLPQLLTENLCSIVGNEERYAFSIIWEFDSKFNVLRDWYGKTIIRSRAALYYGDAQKMIDNPADTSEIASSLRGLMRISQYLKDQRSKAGALFLASQEFKFKVDNDHVNPTDMVTYQTFEANSMIEEWMLFANAAAARKIHSVFPRWALLRRHQPPAEQMFEALNDALMKKIGMRLDPSTSLSLNRSLDRAVHPTDEFFNKLVRMLCTRCLKQAEYFSSGEYPVEEYAHFGLAMPIYTHFTSPIRRYADVIVHRQLAAAIGIMQVSESHTKVEEINALAANINYRHEQAQKAGRDSQNLYTGFFLRNFSDAAIPLEYGYVVKVSDTDYFVLVPKYGQEGKIAREDAKKEYEMLDRVVVRIEMRQDGDVLRTKLVYTIVEDEATIRSFEEANEALPSKKKRE